jgi:hypothetical protein
MLNQTDLLKLEKIIAKCSHEIDIQAITKLLRGQRTNIGRLNSSRLTIGCSVSFQTASNQTVRGFVEKINPKTILVQSDFQKWKVPASMLTINL